MEYLPPIRTEAEYRSILTEVSALVDADPDPNTPAGERLNALVSLVQAYEALCVPIDADLVDRLRLLTKGVEVDLDHPCRPKLTTRACPEHCAWLQRRTALSWGHLSRRRRCSTTP